MLLNKTPQQFHYTVKQLKHAVLRDKTGCSKDLSKLGKLLASEFFIRRVLYIEMHSLIGLYAIS